MMHRGILLILLGLFHRSTCYYYGYNANATWKEANFSCWEMGLRLAVFETVEEWQYAMYHVGQYDLSFNMTESDFWIGVFHRGLTQDTTSIDGVYHANFTELILENRGPPDPSQDFCVMVTPGCHSQFVGKFRNCYRRGDYLCQGFHYVPQAFDWQESINNCKGIGGDLASLDTFDKFYAASQYLVMQGILTRAFDTNVWFNLMSNYTEYTFGNGVRLSDSFAAIFNVAPWDPGEPDCAINCDKCVRLDRLDPETGLYIWEDGGCNVNKHSLCVIHYQYGLGFNPQPSNDEPFDVTTDPASVTTTTTYAQSPTPSIPPTPSPVSTATADICTSDCLQCPSQFTTNDVASARTSTNLRSLSEEPTTSSLETSTSTLSTAKLKRKLEKIRKTLTMPVNNTLKYKYSKICMEDDRPSTTAMGYTLGVVVLIVSWAIIILPDLPVIFFHLIRGTRH